MAKSAATKGEKRRPRRSRPGRDEGGEARSARKKRRSTREGRWPAKDDGISPVRLEFGSAFTRHVFLRAPTKGAEGAAEGLALFVAALAGWNESHLRELMEISASWRRRPWSSSTAPRTSPAARALEDDKAIAARSPPRHPAPNLSIHRAALRALVGLDAWVATTRAATGSRGAPDEDRRVVPRIRGEEEERRARRRGGGGRRRVDCGGGEAWTKEDDGRRGHGVGGIRAATADQRRKPGLQPKENFYRFQQREQRRSELYDLKLKFAADKERVAKLKASRKFRPL